MPLITLCHDRKRELLKPLEFLESPVAGMIGVLFALHGYVASEGD